MKPFFYNHTASSIYPPMEASAIRTAYLIADHAVSDHHTEFLIRISDHLMPASLTVQMTQVLKFLEPEPDKRESIAKLIASYQAVKKRKHRTPKEIGLMKECERVIGQFYKLHVANVEKGATDFGFTGLRDIYTEGRLGFYTVDEADRENDREPYTPASRLLRRMSEIEGETDQEMLFYLADDVFPACFSAREPWYTADDAAAEMPGHSWFEPFVTMPNINHLTGHDLKVVRQQLREQSAAFCTACNEWIAGSYSEGYPGTGLSLFKTSVRPAAQELGNAILNNPIITAYGQAANGDFPLRLWLGEMPAHLIWTYFEKTGIIGTDTTAKLDLLRNDPAYQQKWPVILLQVGDTSHRLTPTRKAGENDDEENEESPLLIRRKTIDIE